MSEPLQDCSTPNASPAYALTTCDSPEEISLLGIRSAWGNWLAIGVVTLSTVFSYIVVTSVAFSAMAVLLNLPNSLAATDLDLAVAQVMKNRIGFVVMLVVPQLSLIFFPILLGLLSPAGWRRQLGLVRGAWPAWAWVAAAMASPLIGMISGGIISQITSDSPALQGFAETILHHSRSGFLLPVMVAIAVFPGICEEVFFRGFLLRHLSRIAPTTVAVLLSSLLFAGFHLDPVHILGVVPLGLWLGFITIRSQSLFPAILAHATNNFVSVLAMAIDDTENVLAPPSAKLQLSILLLGIAGVAGVIMAMRRASLIDSANSQSASSNNPTPSGDARGS